MPARTLLGVLLLALATPAPAAAQAPDEGAAAHVLAEAVTRFEAASTAQEDAYDGDEELQAPACRREIRRMPDRRTGDAGALVERQVLRVFGERLEPALTALRTDLAAAVTQDPVLISGRAAWRRVAKAWTAQPPPGDLCADLAAWRRAGYPRSTVRAALDEIQLLRATSGRGFQRKVAAAGRRMIALGVPEADGERFAGDSGGW